MERLRALAPDAAGYDSLTDAEHVAVLDASDLLDALRAAGYALRLTEAGRLGVTAPDGAPLPEPLRRHVGGLAAALVYVLRIEATAAPLPETCLACAADVWQYSDNGFPYCEEHYRVAKAKALLRAVDRLQAAGSGNHDERVA